MILAVFVSLDDVVPCQPAYRFVSPVVGRYIREVLGQAGVQHSQQGIQPVLQVGHLFGQGGVGGFRLCQPLAALAQLEGDTAAHHVFSVAEAGGNIQHHPVSRPVEHAQGPGSFTAVVAHSRCHADLGIFIEVHGVQVGHSRCVGPHFIDPVVQVVHPGFHPVYAIFHSGDSLVGCMQLAAVHRIGAAFSNGPVRHVGDLLVVGIDAVFVNVGLVPYLVGLGRHIAGYGSVAAYREILFHGDVILEGGLASHFQGAIQLGVAHHVQVLVHIHIIRRCLAGFQSVPGNGGLLDGSFSNSRVMFGIFKGGPGVRGGHAGLGSIVASPRTYGGIHIPVFCILQDVDDVPADQFLFRLGGRIRHRVGSAAAILHQAGEAVGLLAAAGEAAAGSIGDLGGVFRNGLHIVQGLGGLAFSVHFLQGGVHTAGQLAQGTGAGPVGNNVHILGGRLGRSVAVGSIHHRFLDLAGGHGPAHVFTHFILDGLGGRIFDFRCGIAEFFRSGIGDVLGTVAQGFRSRVGDVLGAQAAVARNRRGLIAADGVGLVPSDIVDLAAVDRVFFFSGNGGFQSAIIVFHGLAGHGGLHFAANGRGQVFANGIGHVFCSVVDDILGLIGNGTVLSRVGDVFCRQAAVTGYGRGLVSAYRGAQVGFVVFCHIASDSGLHFAAHSRGQIFANRVGHIFRSVVGDILGLIGDRTVLSRVGDIFCRLGDASAVGAIGYGAADERAACIVQALDDVDDAVTAYQGIFRLGGRLGGSAVPGIAGFDQLFRFVYGAVGVVGLGPVSDGGGQAFGILVHNRGVGAVRYGGGNLVCLLQAVGGIGPIRNVGVGLAGNGVDGGLLVPIGELRFFFCCAPEIGSFLAIGLAHFFRDLVGQLGGSVGAGIVGDFINDGAGSIGFHIQSLVGDLVPGFVGDVFRRQAAVAGHRGGLVSAHRSAQVGFVVFRYIAGHSFGQGPAYRMGFIAAHRSGQVSAHLVFHVAGHIVQHLAAYGIGHIAGGSVHQIFGDVGNGPLFRRIGDILGSLFHRSGVGPVRHRTGDAVHGLVDFGISRIRSFDFLEDLIDLLPESGGLSVGVIGNHIAGFCCIHLFHISVDSIGSRFGLAFFRQGRGTGIGFSIRDIHFAVDRSHIPAMDFGIVVFIQFAGQGLGIEFAINRQILIHRQIPADGSIARGGQRACLYLTGSLDGSGACIQVAPGQGQAVPCHTFGYRKAVTAQYSAGCNILAGNIPGPCHDISAAGIQFAAGCQDIAAYGLDVAGSSVDFAARGSYLAPIGTDFPALGIHVAAAGLDESTVGLDIAIADGGLSIGQGSALYRPGRSHIALGIYSESPVGPFDAAVCVKPRLGFVCRISSGIEPVGILDGAVQAHFNAIFAEGNLVCFAFIHNQGSRCFFGSADSPIRIHLGGVLLQHIVVTQAQSAIDRFCQFGIRCHTACQFIGIRLAQGVESISHVLVDGIEPIHHILVDLLNHLVLGFICPNASIFFRIQSGIQVSHVFANGVGRFHNGPILYGGISLAYIIIRGLFFQIFLHIGDPGIQCRISRFTSGRFRIQVSLQLIRCFVDFVGFVRNPFVQFIILDFSGRRFILVSRSQGGNPLGRIFIDLLDHLVLGCISAKTGSRFFGQGSIQFGHIVADGVGGFHNSPILYGGIVLANIGIRSFLLQIFLHSGDPVIIGLDLFIQADQVISYRVVLFDIGTVFGSFVSHTICSHLTCYSHITRRGDITSRKASRSQFSTDFDVFDCLIFFSAYNQIASAGNMKGRAGLLVR